MMNYKVALGLGSNIGCRLSNLRQSISILENTNILRGIRVSEVYASSALLPANGPKEWDKEFLNMAIVGVTKLAPLEVLRVVQEIEEQLGREPGAKWSPRIIDIDIIAYENLIISEDGLDIPHKQMLNRGWVMLPFSEVWPDWKYPIAGEYYNLSATEIVKKNCSKTQLKIYKEGIYA
jgi:2-amino-4-hydroxy-6-hydroxymethyldihydropteridine diphosphokinase